MSNILKHLEMIQAIITRQASNSFQTKTWTLVLLGAVMGLNRLPKHEMFLFGIGIALLFWILDSYYLSRERKFRELYNKIRKQSKTDLSMSIEEFNGWKCSWMGSMFSVVQLFYVSIVVGLCIARWIF